MDTHSSSWKRWLCRIGIHDYLVNCYLVECKRCPKWFVNDIVP
jgi:hypothetical protein